MKIALVITGEEINAFGGRRIAAVIKKTEEASDVYFVVTNNLHSFSTYLNPNIMSVFTSVDTNVISEKLACYDIVCFSSMTNTINYVYDIVKKLKERNNKVFTMLGGVHAIFHPDEAIGRFDSICIGEGEKPLRLFLELFRDKKDYYNIKGLWFNKNGSIIKNQSETLNSNEELNEYQIGYDGPDLQIYDVRKKRFRPFTKYDYVELNGLAYGTIWTLGCPYFCSYCANSSFAKIDKDYLKLRFPKPEIVVREIEEAVSRRPYISTVSFYDDNLIALPFDVLKDFVELYKAKVNLPFCVFGIHPNTIKKEKVELLASHGMIRTRMGIQSGNDKALRLYKRNTSLESIKNGAAILSEAQRKYNMIPPAYDIICDNPTETRDNTISSLQFYNNIERPFTFNVFSLRAFAGTELTSYFEENKIKCSELPYLKVRPTFSNVMVYLIACGKIPDWIFKKCLRKIKGYDEEQKDYPIPLSISHLLFMFIRGISHLKRLDFSTITGKWLYHYWNIFLRNKISHNRHLMFHFIDKEEQ